MIHLVTGGARAGKSRHALTLAAAAATDRPHLPTLAFLATAQAGDDEMSARIAAHRAERGPRWLTVESPLDVPAQVERLAREHGAVVVDCLTLWVTNLMFHPERPASDRIVGARTAALCGALVAVREAGGHVILVTNEVGLGIVPFEPETRRWRDALGRVNQQVAQVADRVTLLVSGLPLSLK